MNTMKVPYRNLTCEDINVIFKHSLPRDVSEEVIRTVLFQKEYGYDEDSKPVYFKADMIKKFKPQLEYSLGQLIDVHLKNDFTTRESVNIRYDNVLWTDSTTPIIAYLHLLLAAELITPLSPKTSKIHFTKKIIPTLGSYDKAFPFWLRDNTPQLLEHFYGSTSSAE